MNKFFCPLGLLSDEANKISGNQPWYSALYDILGGNDGIVILSIQHTLQTKFIFKSSSFYTYRLRTVRYPENNDPDSHDNLLAHFYFRSLTPEQLDRTGWYINSTLPSDFTWFECIRDIIRLIKDRGFNPHRNDWWKFGYNAIGKIANKLPSWVRYYASGRYRYYPFFILHILASYVKPNFKKKTLVHPASGKGMFSVRQTNNVSAKIQCYFMLKTTNSRLLIMLFNIKELCNIYFDSPEHPIRRLLNE